MSKENQLKKMKLLEKLTEKSLQMNVRIFISRNCSSENVLEESRT